MITPLKQKRKISCGEALLKFTAEGSIDNPDVEAENFFHEDVITHADFKENPRNAKIKSKIRTHFVERENSY